MPDREDVDREAMRDWLENRPPHDPPPHPDDIADDTCQQCGRVLGMHEGPVCNRCANER